MVKMSLHLAILTIQAAPLLQRVLAVENLVTSLCFRVGTATESRFQLKL